MKVIITGATGLVGGALVRACLSNDKISHAFVLTRKELPDDIAKNPNITVILHHDFSAYPPELLSQLAGAEGCLWAIGGKVSDFNNDIETCRKVSVDYTLAAANAFNQHLASQLPDGRKFRFVFCSGKYAEWDQDKPLHFLADTRRIKGQVERGLCEIADNNSGRFDVYCVRPSGILPSDAGIANKSVGKLYGAIGVDHLAKVMVRLLLEGHSQRIIENNELLKL